MYATQSTFRPAGSGRVIKPPAVAQLYRWPQLDSGGLAGGEGLGIEDHSLLELVQNGPAA
jgi:hypothetical protein